MSSCRYLLKCEMGCSGRGDLNFSRIQLEVILLRPSMYKPALWRAISSLRSEYGSLCCSSFMSICHLISTFLNASILKVLMSLLHSTATSSSLLSTIGRQIDLLLSKYDFSRPQLLWPLPLLLFSSDLLNLIVLQL